MNLLGLIKQYGSHPLSVQKIDQYIPHLQSNQIWNSIKTEILGDLYITSQTEPGVQAIIEARMLPVLVSLLRESQDAGVLNSSFAVLGKLPDTHALVKTIIDTDAFSSLVSLMRHPDDPVRVAARNTLIRISRKSEAGPRVIFADVLAAVIQLLNSPKKNTTLYDGRNLLGNICEPLYENVIKLLIPYLESKIISSPTKFMILAAIRARSHSKFAIQNIFQAGLLSVLATLPEALDPGVIQWICHILDDIVMYESREFQEALIEANVIHGLVSFLSRPEVMWRAIHALSLISSEPRPRRVLSSR
ncbi:armadillo-type protein [Mycena sp. CBHHK59/15]|nr:armadillo-type protein [Mycena sp. CBHHK59/15]